METITNEIEALEEKIEQILAEHPHIENLLKAFAPLLLQKTRWLQKMREFKKTFTLDTVRYLAGIPLIQQCQLFFPEDPWQEAGLSLSEAIGKGFPQLAEDMAGLSKQVADGRLDCFTLVNSSTTPDDTQLPAQAEDIGIAPASLQLFLRFLTRLMLTKRSQDMAAELATLSWKKGYCPVCGSFPQLAIIRDKGHRWLQCSGCCHEWQFPRLTCPYCDHEDPENSNYLFVEGKKDDTAFICSSCRKYLITANRSGDLRQTHPDIIAISLAHLDLILQGKGFMPMAECEWNTFETLQKTED